LVIGYAVGVMGNAVGIYTVEISPLEISGILGSIPPTVIALGIFLSFIVGLGLPKIKEFDSASTSMQNY